jgi:hypothetical protein
MKKTKKAEMKPKEDRFRRAYKEACRIAARIPGFPSKDKILVDLDQPLPPLRTEDNDFGALLLPRGHRSGE